MSLAARVDSGIRHPRSAAGQAIAAIGRPSDGYRGPLTPPTDPTRTDIHERAQHPCPRRGLAALDPARARAWPAPASRPNAITVVGTVGAVAGAVVFFTQRLVVRRHAGRSGSSCMLDIVDGAVARAGGTALAVRRRARLDLRPRRRRRDLRRARLVLRRARPALDAAGRAAVPGARLADVLHPRARRGGRADRDGRHRRAGRAADHRAGRHRADRQPFGVPYVQAVALWLLVAASTITVGQRLATVHRQSRARAARRARDAAA